LNVAQDFVRALINDNGKICVPIRQDDGNQGLIWMTVSIHHLQGKSHQQSSGSGITALLACVAIRVQFLAAQFLPMKILS